LKYIAVEGLIGVGKTALAERLAQRLPAQFIRESVADNPLLERFYKDIRNMGFQTQLYFLFARYQQQQGLKQERLFESYAVSDYLFEKDRIFAYNNLNDFEVQLYEKIYGLVVKDVRKPDLVIYLQSRLETIHDRIRHRGHQYEGAIPYEYLETLSDAYNKFFMHYDATPLLIVNADHIDFVHKAEDFENLYREIMAPAQGRRFFSPAKTRK
jgi:deoxyguanosine kinase